MDSTVRVTTKVDGKTRKFWARVLKRGDRFTLYLPLKADGEDKSYLDKDGNSVTPQELVENSLIVKEEPAVMSKLYGLFEVVK